jgi:UDP-glucose 4-epimerase
MKQVLVTGGMGYIGSHTAVALLEDGYEVVLADNLSNSKASVVERLKQITGRHPTFVQIDFCNRSAVEELFASHNFDAVMHFAGLKSVGESVSKPLAYYRNNLVSTITLCEVMQEKAVKKLIFSSSATVYGEPSELPLKESSRTGIGITNPYGRTKFMLEEILKDLRASDSSWRISLLRYFNPIGAHPSGLIGEDPDGIPNNLLPYVQQVAAGTLEKLQIFGADYDTPDGTGVRDYIDVMDLAQGHVAALKKLDELSDVGVYNLGTGKGVSVLEIVRAFEEANGVTIPHEVVDRRAGDIAICFADPSKANKELGWQTRKNLQESCTDAWRWQQFATKNL